MNKYVPIVFCVRFLFGCSNRSQIDHATALRNRIVTCEKCEFDTVVTLDYGDSTYSFRAVCVTDSSNNMKLKVIEPAPISGIEANIYADSGRFTFDNEILGFELIANDQIAPISIPWLFIEALRGGYIASCGNGDSGSFIRIDDSFKQTEYSLELWLNQENMPIGAELFWEGKRFASIKFNSFIIV